MSDFFILDWPFHPEWFQQVGKIARRSIGGDSFFDFEGVPLEPSLFFCDCWLEFFLGLGFDPGIDDMAFSVDGF